jgi:release factor glutamine methyltransferase
MPAASPLTEDRPLGDLIAAGTAWLAVREIGEPRIKCELLAARLLGVPRLQLPLERSRILPAPLVDALRRGVVRLGNHEPIQYVLGEWDFRGLTLRVDRRALIPRPETEQLVQLVLDEPDLRLIPSPLICDIGTGCGCIAISLAVEAPGGIYTAVDREAEALALARENAARHAVAQRITFLQGESCAHAAPGSLDVVVSNPPYIATAVCAALPRQIRDYEPNTALDGGADGLDILRDIVHDTALRLKPRGWCFLEIGDDQGPAVRDLLTQVGFETVEILRDLAGKIRFARARMG